MKKKIVSTLVVIGLLIVLGGYSYNVQYRQKPEIKHFTAFFSVTGRPLGMQNDIKEIIADKIGADCEENWLVGQSRKRCSIRTLLRENIRILFLERKHYWRQML